MEKATLSKEALELAKEISDKVWSKYDDSHGYRTEKQLKNKQVSTEVPDNIWFFWNQFDGKNKSEFLFRLVASDNKAKTELIEFLKPVADEEAKALDEFLERMKKK